MKIICLEHYNKVLEYAASMGDKTLNECIEQLRRWETNSNRPCEMELHKDFAPHSFIFKQRYEDQNFGVVGGLVYHGTPDESYSFQITPKNGWEIHT